MTGPSQSFWQERFVAGNLPWDRGGANPQLAAWLADGTIEAGARIVVPGCGQGWEVVELAAAAVTAIGLDYAPSALALCRGHLDRYGCDARLVEADVLQWQPEAPVDAVFEQTCLCALYPDLWAPYAAQLHRWIKPGGKLLALFMQARKEGAQEGFIEGPPYHCDIHAMRAIFPATLWDWPKPPYPLVPHHGLQQNELAVVLTRK